MSTEPAPSTSFITELRRRKVPRSLAAYVVVCWIIIQAGEVLLPVLNIETDQPLRLLVFFAIMGSPICIAIAWFYQITKTGIVRTQSFAERRVLNNLNPINDRRRAKVGQYFGKEEQVVEYPWLILFEKGPLEGLSYGITDSIIIGRSLDCDITILSNHVSRQHAKLSVTDMRLNIEDMGSANGTIVNGTAIDQAVELAHDDEVLLQDISFRVSQSYSRSGTENSAMNQTTVVKHD